MPKDYEDDALFHSMQLGLSAGGGRNTNTITGKQADTTDNDDTTFFEISTSTDDPGDPGVMTWGFGKGTGRSIIRIIMDVKVEHSGEDGYYEVWGWDSDGNYEKIGTIRTTTYTTYYKRYFYKECDKVYLQLDLRFYSEVNTHKTYAKIYTFENTLKPQYSLPAGTNILGKTVLSDGANDLCVITGALATCDRLHCQIEDGNVYSISKLFTGIANGNSVMVLIKCHADFTINGYATMASEGAWHVSKYETPTITADGTALSAINTNRSSANTVNSTFFHTPTISANGTLLSEKLIGSSRESPGSGEFNRWHLKKGLNYLIVMTNASGLASDASIRLLVEEEAA